MSQPLLSLHQVTLRYEHGIRALDDVSVEVAEGEHVCVLGPNGSGKSTLASVLCGLLAPDEGTVSLVGEQVYGPNGIDFEAYRRARRQLGLVFQNPDDQIVTSVVEEDVAFGPENLGVGSDEIGRRVARELHRVALDDYAQADPANLSGGQKQRVAIAGALAMEPRVLVLDEPGALLDVRGRRGIMRVMEKLHRAGTTIVHVTHFMEEALAADRVIVLDQGHLVLEGPPHEVFSHCEQLMGHGLDEPFTARLADALRQRRIGIPWTCNDDELEFSLIQALEMTGASTSGAAGAASRGKRCGAAPASLSSAGEDPSEQRERIRSCSARGQERSSSARSPREARPAAAAIHAKDLSYSYGNTDAREARHPALDKVTFTIPQGSFTSIVGQTGSGKSTLLRLLCALEAPDSGQLTVDGIGTSDRRKRRLLHGRVGYVMQHPERQLFAETVFEDVAFGPTNMHLPAQEVERRCEEALALVGLTGREKASPFHLSGGQQRLCALAGILAMEPHILVLDEPTAGLDPRGREQLRAIIARIHAQGITVIQVTHSMDDAATAQQVIVLNEGQLLMQGTPAEVFSAQTGDQLSACGLGLPKPLIWALRLEKAGFPALDAPLTSDDLADRIVALLDGLPAGASTSHREGVRHGL